MTGLYHLLPLAMFIWWLGSGGEPAPGAAHAAVAAIIVAGTHHPLKALVRRQSDYLAESVRRSVDDCLGGLVTGARLMVPVVIASAAAGLVLGALSFGGPGEMLSAAVTWIAGRPGLGASGRACIALDDPRSRLAVGCCLYCRSRALWRP